MILRLYTYGHWHISLCALLLYVSGTFFSSQGFHLSTGLHVFFATQFIYTLHRVVSSDKMIGQEEGRYSFTRDRKNYTSSVLILSGILALLFFFFLPTITQYLLLVSGCLSLGYILPIIFHKRLRDIGVAKILLISLVWGVVSILSFRFEGNLLPLFLFFIEHFFFIFALTIPFDVRDRTLDKKAKVSNLVNTIGMKTIKSLMLLLIVLAMSIAVALFYIKVYSVFLLIGLILFYSFQFMVTRTLDKKRSEFYYLIFLDGLILLKGLIYLALSTSS